MTVAYHLRASVLVLQLQLALGVLQLGVLQLGVPALQEGAAHQKPLGLLAHLLPQYGLEQLLLGETAVQLALG
jgi:hypothetical protein